VTALLGHALALAGDRAQAATLLTSRLFEREDITRLAAARAAGGLILIREFQAAAGAAATALGAAQRFGAKLAGAEALLHLAAVAAHDSPLRSSEAERRYTTALERAVVLEARPLLGHCQLGLGVLYARMRSTEQARERLGIASTMYREMRMAEWVRRASGELASLDGSRSYE
jgi:hypothetical protein